MLRAAIVCLGLLGLFQITIERLECSKAISGWDGYGMGLGMGWKSLRGVILRAPLCGANKTLAAPSPQLKIATGGNFLRKN